MSKAERRLAALERKAPASGQGAVIVIYDPETLEPLQPVPPGNRVQVWIPDNGRDKVQAPVFHPVDP